MIKRTSLPTLALLLVAACSPLASSGQTTRQRVALVIGVDKYERSSPFLQLKHAEDDAKAMGRLLQERLGFKVRALLGPAATKRNIENTFKTLMSKGDGTHGPLGKGDVVILMFSGHGQKFPLPFYNWCDKVGIADVRDPPTGKSNVSEEERAKQEKERDQQMALAQKIYNHYNQTNGLEQSYLCPPGAVSGDPNTLIAVDDLIQASREYKAQVLFLIDACRTDPDNPGRGSIKGLEGTKSYFLPSGAAVFFSCSEDQASWEDDAKGLGFFTEYVLQGLSGEAMEKGVLTWGSLATYVEDEMNKKASQDRIRSVQEKTALNRGTPARFVEQNPALAANHIGTVMLDWRRPSMPKGWFQLDSMGKPMSPTAEREDVITNSVFLPGKDLRLPKVLQGPYELSGMPRFLSGGNPLLLKLILINGPEPFHILETKVSNSLYEEFYQHESKKAGEDWRTGSFKNPGDTSLLPVTNISAIQADDFCAWLSTKMIKDAKEVRLPTASEWARAAGHDAWLADRKNPGHRGPYRAAKNPKVAVHGNPVPVGTAEDDQSPYTDVRDMAGNGWEWTAGDPRLLGDRLIGGQSFKAGSPLKYTDFGKPRFQPETVPDIAIGFRVVVILK